jgi:membrane-associated phospholipid phosphatase
MKQTSKHNYSVTGFFIVLFIVLPFKSIVAQNINDSTTVTDTIAQITSTESKIFAKQFIVPAIFISYGLISLESDGLKELNFSTKDEIREDYPFFRSRLDNFSQFAPAVTVFGLQASGVKGKNNWKDEAVIYAMAMGISMAIVVPLKYITKVERPDRSNFLSFPSGHTANAFASAEFLRREYWGVSPWIGVAGYAVAAGTGAFRMYNNKHWFSDVVAGAGFGIASTTLSYIIYDRVLKKHHLTFNITPVYRDKNIGLLVMKSF